MLASSYYFRGARHSVRIVPMDAVLEDLLSILYRLGSAPRTDCVPEDVASSESVSGFGFRSSKPTLETSLRITSP